MWKLQFEWTMKDGKSYEEWTIPWEVAIAENEANFVFFDDIKIGKTPPMLFQFHAVYQIHSRISEKPIGKFENWRSNVTHLALKDIQSSNFTKPEVTKEH